MSKFSDLSDRMKKIDRGIYLGRLVMYTVTDVTISHSDLMQALYNCQLDGYAPRLPSDVDVFRRVCSKAQRKRSPDDVSADVYHNYLVRDLPMDADMVHKLLVRETVAAGKLAYRTSLCTIDFIRADSTIEIACEQGDIVAADIADEIRANYRANRGTINSYGIREGLIRKVLVTINGTNVHGGGGAVYFVSEDHGDVVDNLEKFAGLIPGVTVHSLPLLDDTKQRAMLREAFVSETAEEIDRLVNEIAELNANPKPVSAEKVDNYFAKLTAMRSKVKEQTDLLEETMDEAESRMEIFQNQVLQLSTKVPEDG